MTIIIVFRDVFLNAAAVVLFVDAVLDAAKETVRNAIYAWLHVAHRFSCVVRRCYCVVRGCLLVVDLVAEIVVVVRRAKDMVQIRLASKSLL